MKRKPLNDALAEQFVYGENSTPSPKPTDEETPQSAPENRATPPKSSIMDKLQAAEPREATKRFTVDLPESMHRKLSILSAKTGRSKAEIVRTLLEDILQNLDE